MFLVPSSHFQIALSVFLWKDVANAQKCEPEPAVQAMYLSDVPENIAQLMKITFA